MAPPLLPHHLAVSLNCLSPTLLGESLSLSLAPNTMPSVPAKLGYRMPAEWEPHEATWIAWPHERTDWPGKFAAIPWVYAEIVRHLSHCERVNILVNNAQSELEAKKVLGRIDVELGKISFWRIP